MLRKWGGIGQPVGKVDSGADKSRCDQSGIISVQKITTEGTNYASVTVTTEAGQKRSSAFVTVNFKITDDTVVPVSDVKLDQSELAFEIVRTLEGDRLNPTERYSVTPSKRLYETITPEYADNKM